MNKTFPKFSVSLSVYKNDNPKHFKLALKSIVEQTTIPNEIVIVVDGPIPEETQSVLRNFELKHKAILKLVWFKENQGHGIARNRGLQECSNSIIALMDSDDICVSNRFELQLKEFQKDKDLSVLGGAIEEFFDEEMEVTSLRKLPLASDDIARYIKFRCPFNQVSVMFRKKDVLEVGGYKHWFCNEDYYLWIRMFESKKVFKNLEDVLVKVRASMDYFDRRGGKKYFISEYNIQKLMLTKGIISLPIFLYNISIRFVLQIVLTNSMRKFVFKKFARN